MEEVINALPDAGGSGVGGSEPQTCTLTFSGSSVSSNDDGWVYFYQTVENGEVVIKQVQATAVTSVEMLCGGLFVAMIDINLSNAILSATPGISFSLFRVCYGGQFGLLCVQSNLDAGATGTITITYNNSGWE